MLKFAVHVMERKHFIKLLGIGFTMTTLASFKNILDSIPQEESKMPALFVGHGSPMNAFENNEFSRKWLALGQELPNPKLILCISAHWLTNGTFVTAMQSPKTIHDFGGFPKALFDAQYPAPGNPEFAKTISNLFSEKPIGLNTSWGLDHGTWSVLKQMFPKADIPVIQLSIDASKDENHHFELAKKLKELRKKGVLIIGSGNIVHNLGMIAWDKMNENFAFDWATEANENVKKFIQTEDYACLISFPNSGKASRLAIPTNDHYLPLLYAMAVREKSEKIEFFNDKAQAGSLTMTSVRIG